MNREQKQYLIDLLNTQYENVADGFVKSDTMTWQEELTFILNMKLELELEDQPDANELRASAGAMSVMVDDLVDQGFA